METQLRLELSYTSKLAQAPVESKPLLICYLDGQNYDRAAEYIQLPEDNPHQRVEALIGGRYKATTTIADQVPKVVFYVTAMTHNDQGSPCRVDAGVAVAPVHTLISSKGKMTLPLIIHEPGGLNRGVEKGVLTVRSLSAQHPPIAPAPVSANTTVLAAQEAADRWFQTYYDRSNRMGNTIQGSENIRCPIYYGEFGLIGQPVPLPAAAFGLFEVPETNDRFWLNAMNTVRRRNGVDASLRWKDMSVAEQATLLVGMQVLLTQYFDYIGDKTDKNSRFIGNDYNARLRQPSENFGNALVLGSGDCEDLALAIIASKCAFEDYDTRVPVLQQMQRMSKQYMAALSLDAVTAGQIRDASDHAPIGAHMNIMYLPTYRVKQAMGVKPGQAHATLPFRKDEPYAKELPFLVGEGTGMFEPYGSEHTMEEMQRIGQGYMAMPSTNAFKKPILHPVGAPGSFFVGSIVGFTNYWMRLGGDVGGFWYVDSRGSDGGSRGLYHTDIVQGHANVRIVPHPPFERVHLEHMNHAVKLRPPPRPLMLSAQSEKEQRSSNVLERVQSAIGSSANNNAAVALTMYARDHQLTPEIGAQMVKEAKAAGVTSMEYHWEPISDDVGGYEIKLYV